MWTFDVNRRILEKYFVNLVHIWPSTIEVTYVDTPQNINRWNGVSI